jgi:hypothetical protein
MTPFNIGRRIELNDFTTEEAAPLANGLGPDEETTTGLLSRVLYWTGGHPYLTQRLCRALAEHIQHKNPEAAGPATDPPVIPTLATVDALANKLFLSRQARDRDDNLIFVRERILRGELDVAGLLYLYRRIRGGARVSDDETNPQITVLRLSGIIRGNNGVLQVRNRIYAHVFDQGWATANMPHAEIRRQRRAGRRGVLIGLGIGLILLFGYLLVGPAFKRHRQALLAQRTVERLYAKYAEATYYQGSFESTFELGVGGTVVPVQSSGTLYFERPDRVNLVLKSALTSPEAEIRIVSNGRVRWIFSPSVRQYHAEPVLHRIAPPPEPKPSRDPLPPWLHAPVLPGHGKGPEFPVSDSILPRSVEQQIAPMHILPLFRLLLFPESSNGFAQNAQNIEYEGETDLDGQQVLVIRWRHSVAHLLASLGVPNIQSDREGIPFTAWVSRDNGLVLRLRVDLSPWAAQLAGPSEAPITGLIITEHHRPVLQTGEVEDPEGRFEFRPPPGSANVGQLQLPRPDFGAMVNSKRQMLRSIPPRSTFTPSNLIDLSRYYNASFTAPWHPGPAGNTLEMLPPGLLYFGGVLFDARGIVQLSSKSLKDPAYPKQINGIRIDQRCRQLHFLHATGWKSPDGTRVGSYVLGYEDGTQIDIPLIYGKDLRDWNGKSDSAVPTEATLVWSAKNLADFNPRLFKSSWDNPRPEHAIDSLDFISTGVEAAPFLIAITAEQ